MKLYSPEKRVEWHIKKKARSRNPMRWFATNSVLVAVLCFYSQAAFAHKDIEPRDATEATNWIEEALHSFSNVKVARKLYRLPATRTELLDRAASNR